MKLRWLQRESGASYINFVPELQYWDDWCNGWLEIPTVTCADSEEHTVDKEEHDGED